MSEDCSGGRGMPCPPRFPIFPFVFPLMFPIGFGIAMGRRRRRKQGSFEKRLARVESRVARLEEKAAAESD
jgi:hypothetical protein